MSKHNISFLKQKKITLNYLKSAAMGLFQGTQERVRNSRGTRAISVRAIEGLPYVVYGLLMTVSLVKQRWTKLGAPGMRLFHLCAG